MTRTQILRRKVLTGLFSTVIASCGCGIRPAKAQWPGGALGSNGDQRNGSVGCLVMGSSAALHFQNLSQASSRSGNQMLDRLFPNEIRFLESNFAVRPGFGFYDDSSSPNAFATPKVLWGGIDGTVAFGRTLVFTNLQNQIWGTVIAGIMAHEWAHIYQFKHGMISDWVRDSELQADFMAGWHMGKKVHDGIEPYPADLVRLSMSKLEAALFGMGDYEFSDENHHGTPRERVDAMSFGFSGGVNGRYRSVIDAYEAGKRLLL